MRETDFSSALVLTSGGFRAGLDGSADARGAVAPNFPIRAVPYSGGVVLCDTSDQGAQSVGDLTQSHAVAFDGHTPQYDDGNVTRLMADDFQVHSASGTV